MKLTMKLIEFVVILFCLFHSFANCDRHEFNKDGPFASSDWLQIVDNFLGQNFPDFLIGLTYKNISESCRTQKRNFAEKINNEKSLTSNLDNTFWHLKSKFNFLLIWTKTIHVPYMFPTKFCYNSFKLFDQSRKSRT